MITIPSLMALRCFDASARHASFTKAADEVHITQGAVSHQILSLEAQLGVPLFVRKRTGMKLTAAGNAYWIEVSRALRQLERATQNLLMHKGEGGNLNLCVASSFSTYWLIPRLSGFVAAHPEITLNLSTQIGPIDFANSLHDASIEYCEGPSSGLHAELILPLSLQPYAARGIHASRKLSTSKDTNKFSRLLGLLNSYPLIRHSTVPFAWPNWLESAGLQEDVSKQQINSGPQYDLLSMALNGVIAGLGIALLPDYIASGALAAKQIERLSEKSWTSDKAYYLRYPEWKSDLVALQRFQQWLKAA